MSTRVRSLGPEASLTDAMREMDRYGIRHLPVVEDGRLVGVLSDRDLLEATGGSAELARERSRELVPCLSNLMVTSPATGAPDDSATVLAGRLAGARIGCLPIVEGGQLVGLVTETDLLAALRDVCGESSGDGVADAAVSECMTRRVSAVAPSASAWVAARQMRDGYFRHLPVIEDGTLVGMLSDRDLRRAAGRGDFGRAQVSDLMSRDPVTLAATDRISRAAALLCEMGVGSLPVVSEGAVCGIVSVTDLLAFCATDWPRNG